MASATKSTQDNVVGTKKLPCGHKNFRLPDSPLVAGDSFERRCDICKKTYKVEILESEYLTRILGRPSLRMEITRLGGDAVA